MGRDPRLAIPGSEEEDHVQDHEGEAVDPEDVKVVANVKQQEGNVQVKIDHVGCMLQLRR
jgi:hypothetical protein